MHSLYVWLMVLFVLINVRFSTLSVYLSIVFFSFNFSDSYLPANWALRRQQREDIEEDEYVTVSVGGMVIALTLVMVVVTVMSLVSVMVVVLEREDIEEGECVTVCLEVGAG